MNHHQLKRLKQAQANRKAGKLKPAFEALTKLNKELPASAQIRTELGLTNYSLGQVTEAATIFQKLHEESPEDMHILNCCGVAYMQLGMFDLAIQFFKKYVGKKNDDYEAWINLCCAAGKNNQFTDAAFYGMQALSLRPLESKAHQNMGSVLLALGRPKDALISFETALELDPENIAARSNIGNIYGEFNQPAQALEVYEYCLSKAPKDSLMESDLKYRMSFEYMKLGRLDIAWNYYDHGFVLTDTQSRTPKRKFEVPQWKGEPLATDKKLMIWREQGLGDELMFMPMVRDVLQEHQNIILECDPRLVKTLQRSFPECVVRTQAFYSPPNGLPVVQDYDFHIPLGGLLGIYRNKIDLFKNSQPYLVADSAKKSDFKNRINSNKKLLGICWRSGTLNIQRNQHYTPLSAWKDVFALHEQFEFINLQYGDCESELRAAEEEFGVKIHRWNELDLMNDLDSVASLIDATDHVISAGTAVAQMTMAIGKPLSLFLPSGNPWVLLGQSNYPWYPNNPVKLYRPADDEVIDSVLPRIAHDLINLQAA